MIKTYKPIWISFIPDGMVTFFILISSFESVQGNKKIPFVPLQAKKARKNLKSYIDNLLFWVDVLTDN